MGENYRVGDELCLPHANRVIQYYRNSFCRIKSWWVSRLHYQEDNERFARYSYELFTNESTYLSDNAHVVKLHLKLSFDKLCLNIDFDRRVAD